MSRHAPTERVCTQLQQDPLQRLGTFTHPRSAQKYREGGDPSTVSSAKAIGA